MQQTSARAERTKLVEDGLVNVDDVATMTGLAVSTVYQLASRRAFPTVRLGRKLMFPRRGILEYLADRVQI